MPPCPDALKYYINSPEFGIFVVELNAKYCFKNQNRLRAILIKSCFNPIPILDFKICVAFVLKQKSRLSALLTCLGAVNLPAS